MKLKIFQNYSLAKLTSTKTGGPAKYFLKINKESELIEGLKWAKDSEIRWMVLGDGTNTIASDSGYDGLIIKNEISELKMSKHIYLGSGNNLGKSVNILERAGYAGMENLIGIPGTIGGAIYGCSGSHGQEIKDHLVKVKCLDSSNLKIKWLSKSECKFNYRDSIFKKKRDLIILGVELSLPKSDPEELIKISRDVTKKRRKIYKKGLPCPGSFFKNIVVSTIKPIALRNRVLADLNGQGMKGSKISCGYLLEQVGAKKLKVGKIKISETHSNFIYNSGGGKTRDILKMAKILKEKVKERYGLILEEEVQLI